MAVVNRMRAHRQDFSSSSSSSSQHRFHCCGHISHGLQVVLSPSHIARCKPKVMHLELAVDYSSSSRTSDRRERGGVIRESNSSFGTSATQMRGVGGDGSSSDLSMSPPPPPTFDFVVNDAKGKLQKWML